MSNFDFHRMIRYLFVSLAALVALHYPLRAEADVPTAEREALVALYTGTDGAHWTENWRWNTSAPVCAADPTFNWYRITCDAAGEHVTGINLGSNGLRGTLAPLAALSKLNYFRADFNVLSGEIPPLAGLADLRFFIVNSNQLTGPVPALAGLANLEEFWVSSNKLSGPVSALTGLSKLRVFHIENNELSGALPAVPSPSVLTAGGSAVCLNYFDHIGNPGWDAATGYSPWFTNCPAYTVTPSAGPGGSISPNYPLTIAKYRTAQFTVKPNAGYVADVGGSCGGALIDSTYRTGAIVADCTVQATFTKTFTVTPSAGANGTISPSTAQAVRPNQRATFAVTPASGYWSRVSGTCGGTLAGNTYTTNQVTADCSVVVDFVLPKTWVYPGPTPCDTTLRACMAAAGEGDTIRLDFDGRNSESMGLSPQKSLSLEAAPGRKPQISNVFMYVDRAPLAFSLRGLGIAGGVFIAGSQQLDLSVRDCTIEGAGIVASDAGDAETTPRRNRFDFVGNRVLLDDPAVGISSPGIFIQDTNPNFTATIVDNEIRFERDQPSTAGITVQTDGDDDGAASQIVIDRNRIVGRGFERGIDIRSMSTSSSPGHLDVSLTNNLIAGQAGASNGDAGVAIHSDGATPLDALVVNNTVVDGRLGIQVTVKPAATSVPQVRLHNNIVAHHASYGVVYDSRLLAASSHNLAFANGAGASPPGTIEADPRFADRAAKDYRIEAGSPAIDAGLDSALPLALTFDAAGNARRVGAIDIGAFESAAVPAPGYIISASAGAHGTISPAGTQRVDSGATAAYIVTSDAGYNASVGGTCGGTLIGTSFTTHPITADCTVVATFAPVVHTVTPLVGANGVMTPSTPQTVMLNGTLSFAVTPASGFEARVGGTCGGTLIGTTYTTNPITADCTVAASFITTAPVATTTSLSLAPNPATVGQNVVANVRVGETPSTALPTATAIPAVSPAAAGGSVVVSGGGASCSASLDAGGNAVCTLTFATSGTYAIAASYLGDVTHAPSNATASITVNAVTQPGGRLPVPAPMLDRLSTLLLVLALCALGLRMRASD